MKIDKFKAELEAAIYEGVNNKMHICNTVVEKVLEDYHKAKMQEKKEYLENIYKNAKDEKNSENQ